MFTLSLEKALQVYRSSFSDHSKFGVNLQKSGLDEIDIVVLEKDISVQNVTPLKFDFYVFLLSIEGDLLRHIDQFDYKISKYSFQLLPPNTFYSFENISPITKTYIIAFKASYLQDCCNTKIVHSLFDFHNTNMSPITLSMSLYHRVINMFEDIYQALKEGEEESHFLVKLILMRLLLLLKNDKINQNKLHLTQKSRAWQLTYRYLDLIEMHFLEDKKVSDYAKKLGITSKHLSETTKTTLGNHALFYIHQRLLKESLYLLKYSDLSIVQIASKLSFQTPSEFSRFFKTYYKMTPKAFRLGI
ncbi:helix-turn-helix domain-containing protein [Sulfurospirillum cavolei]|uniref:helix-turn-helix domain-containing protein n=1 Tax=Sulfurospirillum cavolei TaxID=366522 RepID=UPI00076495FB|nr:AraC family transcriptional regulator [Sulfurospirillum cavolei]